jgi:thioredoxin reductase
MNNQTIFDVIIIGGSYAGLSAAMTLGRALRQVLIFDSNQPCNKQVHHAHNLLTRDGEPPAEIAAKAREQVLQYPTIQIIGIKAASVLKQGNLFEVITASGEKFRAKKLLFAAGVVDLMPELPGFAACWGISIAHCPYCHGYEVSNTKIGVLGNGDLGFDFAKLIHNWTNDLTLFTNGKLALTEEQQQKLKAHKIAVAQSEIETIEQENGQIKNLVLKDGSKFPLTTLFARVPFKLSTTIAQELGCELTETGLIKTDAFQKTSIPGVFAAGDNASPMRSLSAAIAAGTVAGAIINHELINECF